MGYARNNEGLTRGLAGLVVLLGLLAGLLAVTASGALAQTTTTPDEPEATTSDEPGGEQEAAATPDGPQRVYALTANDKLLRFDGDDPKKAKSKPIGGLEGGESLIGIDFRPSSQVPAQQGVLYGVGDQSYVYTIDPKTAVATRGPQLTASGAPVELRGTSFGIDFNPTVDRLRIISDANQNLRVNVDTGATLTDTDLAYTAGDPNAGTDPVATATAYRNSLPAAFGGVTEQYDIETAADVLVEQTPPNSGTLVTEGPLGVDTNELVGFDIVTIGSSPAGDRGFAALQPEKSKKSKFYAIDLETGQATKIGRIGDNRRGTQVEGIAIPIGQQ